MKGHQNTGPPPVPSPRALAGAARDSRRPGHGPRDAIMSMCTLTEVGTPAMPTVQQSPDPSDIGTPDKFRNSYIIDIVLSGRPQRSPQDLRDRLDHRPRRGARIELAY